MKSYKIATIAGDGIGKEVVPESLKVLKEVAKKHQFNVQFDEFDFASCDYYQKNGKMLPDDWKDKIGSHDAIYFGAVGDPVKVPDHISLWGSLLKFRRECDQYINLKYNLINLILPLVIIIKKMEKCFQTTGKTKLVNTTLFILVQ